MDLGFRFSTEFFGDFGINRDNAAADGKVGLDATCDRFDCCGSDRRFSLGAATATLRF